MADVRDLPGHEPDPLHLRFGLNDVWPESAQATWGCRLIVTQDGYVDFVPDRQDMAGQDPWRGYLHKGLNNVLPIPALKDRVSWLLRNGFMQTRVQEDFVLYMGPIPYYWSERDRDVNDHLTIVANTNASAGYCYVSAWYEGPHSAEISAYLNEFIRRSEEVHREVMRSIVAEYGWEGLDVPDSGEEKE